MHKGTAINAQIAIDLLTLDDNDGNIDNGSPHYQEICKGFAAHGMTCPPLKTGLTVSPVTALASEGPAGGPSRRRARRTRSRTWGRRRRSSTRSTPQAPTPWISITNGSGSLAIGQQAQVTVAINQTAAADAGERRVFRRRPVHEHHRRRRQHDAQRDAAGGCADPDLHRDVRGWAGRLHGRGRDQPVARQRQLRVGAARALHAEQPLLRRRIRAARSARARRRRARRRRPAITIADTSVVKLRFKYFVQTEHLSSFDKATAEVSINGGAFASWRATAAEP